MLRHYHRCPAGFTLFEMIIVLLLLGIMALVGMPSLYASLEDIRLTGATDEVVSALQFAQRTAVVSGSQTKVTIDQSAETIQVEQFTYSADLLGSETQLSEGVVESGAFASMERPMNRGVDYIVNLDDEQRFAGVDISDVDFSGGNNVTYDSFGYPSSGGTVTLAYNQRQVIIGVDDYNGKLTITK